MKKKEGTILKQIMRPFVIFMIVLVIANAVVLAIFSTSYYLSDQYKEASSLARNTVSEYEAYKSLGWLFDYWEEFSSQMEHVHGDEEWMEKTDRKLRELQPQIGDITSVTVEEAAKMDPESRKLFAELCYCNLSKEFDRLKRAYSPLYLYSFKIRGNQMYIFVTGTLENEKRESDGGELFELGSIMGYQEGAYAVLDEIVKTKKPVNDLELSRGAGADRDVIHAFEPVYCNGEMKAIVGVSLRSAEMIDYSLRMMRTMLFITGGFFAVMLIFIVHNIRKIVVKPIDKEQKTIVAYEQDKDSLNASRQLGEIKTGNEIERLARSFSSMVTELDRYMEDFRAVTAEKERIGAELNVATQIQMDMLPTTFPPFPEHNEFDLYATMTPAKEVGGDFYDFFLVDDDHIGLVMADVSGKGVPAALFMVIAKTLIKNRALLGGSPSQVLEYANDQLCEGNEAQLFVTVWFAVLEISTGKGLAANAGHEHPAIKRAGGEWELVEYKHSPAVATMEGIPFKEHEFELHPGDWLYVYTDGVAEATDKNDELYGTDRMLAALQKCTSEDPKDLLESVKEDIDGFVKDAPQFDDITMLGFHYRGKA